MQCRHGIDSDLGPLCQPCTRELISTLLHQDRVATQRIADLLKARDEEARIALDALFRLDAAKARIVELTTSPTGRVEPPEEPEKLCGQYNEFVVTMQQAARTGTPLTPAQVEEFRQWHSDNCNRCIEVRKWGHSWQKAALQARGELDTVIAESLKPSD